MGDKSGNRTSRHGDTLSGSGAEEIPVGAQSSVQFPVSFTPDGKFLSYVYSNPKTALEIHLIALEGNREPRPFVASQFSASGGLFSPDGHCMAYVSEESGTRQVYVQSFPGPGAKWQISASGAVDAAWARNGHELFYTDGREIFSVAIATQPCLASSKPRTLMPFNQVVPGPLFNGFFDVAPDGQHFLVVVHNKENTAPEELDLVEGWLEELARTVRPGSK